MADHTTDEGSGGFIGTSSLRLGDFTFRFTTTGAFIGVGVFDTFFFKFEIDLFINLEFPFFGMKLMR